MAAKVTKKTKTVATKGQDTNLKKMTVKELKERLNAYGLEATGLKPELLKRLETFLTSSMMQTTTNGSGGDDDGENDLNIETLREKDRERHQKKGRRRRKKKLREREKNREAPPVAPNTIAIRFFFWSSFVSVSFVDATATATATARRRRRSRREGLLDDDDEVALNEGAATERIVTVLKR